MKMRGKSVTVCAAWLHDILLFAGCYVLVPAISGMETVKTNYYLAAVSGFWCQSSLAGSVFERSKCLSFTFWSEQRLQCS